MLIQCFCISGVYAQITPNVSMAAKKAPEKYYQISENQLGYVLSSFAAQSGMRFEIMTERSTGWRS